MERVLACSNKYLEPPALFYPPCFTMFSVFTYSLGFELQKQKLLSGFDRSYIMRKKMSFVKRSVINQDLRSDATWP